MSTEQVRESRLRRALDQKGYALKKTPARSSMRDHYGVGYMVIDAHANFVVLGCCERGYEATLEEVEAWTAALTPEQEGALDSA